MYIPVKYCLFCHENRAEKQYTEVKRLTPRDSSVQPKLTKSVHLILNISLWLSQRIIT